MPGSLIALKQPITVAVLGSGGREHALAQKIARSPLCNQVLVVPGNPGIERTGIRTEPADFTRPEDFARKLRDLQVGLVVIGPDDLLAAGLTDGLERAGLRVFGPSRQAAKLEWSKYFAKEILEEARVPTGRYKTVSCDGQLAQAAEAVGGYPLVLKFDGLALGKGVSICNTEAQAKAFLDQVFRSKKFQRSGSVGELVVAEEFLRGRELSLFAITDGTDYLVLEPACDHKRLLEGDQGPNTGGMGAYSPVPWIGSDRIQEMAAKIFSPVLSAMRARQVVFKGLLYAGLMIHDDEFWVLEFNARFGDPETQAILPRMDSDLLPLLYGAAVGKLGAAASSYPLRWKKDAAVNIVAASRGYPEKPETGFEISFRFDPDEVDDEKTQLYYAGVRSAVDGVALRNSGGRVLSVTCLGEDIDRARGNALAVLDKIRFEGIQFRRDIGGKA